MDSAWAYSLGTANRQVWHSEARIEAKTSNLKGTTPAFNTSHILLINPHVIAFRSSRPVALIVCAVGGAWIRRLTTRGTDDLIPRISATLDCHHYSTSRIRPFYQVRIDFPIVWQFCVDTAVGAVALDVCPTPAAPPPFVDELEPLRGMLPPYRYCGVYIPQTSSMR